MILQELTLKPFAGLSSLKVVFSEGLNVVLGPNEAGKTTLVNALKMALFMPAQYDKRTFEREISRFLPLRGGDTIQVELTFRVNQDSYLLLKSWGKKREASLTLPRGGLLTDPKLLQEKLQELLVLKEGTYHHVLFAYQSRMGSTLDSLNEPHGPVQDLASLLRKGFLETDGISIEQLGRKIEKRYTDYFSRWDRDLRRPENNRGIENPFKKEVGEILGAYYKKERLSLELNRVLNYERRVDELNREMEVLLSEIASLREFTENRREFVEDARKRVVLELERKNLQDEEGRLKEVSQKWPALEQDLKNMETGLADLKKRLSQLTEELDQAKMREASKRKIEKLSRVEKKRKELQEAMELQSGMKKITKEDYREIQRLHDELSRLKTSIQAGKIGLTLMTDIPMELKIKKDFEEEVSHSLHAGQSFEVSAAGQIRLVHQDWDLKVRSGEMDFDRLQALFTRVSKEYGEMLGRLDIHDADEGKRLYESYEKQSQNVGSLRKQFDEALEGERYEELEKSKDLLLETIPVRSMADIGRELGEAESRIRQTEREMEGKTRQLKDWERDFGSKDRLLDLLLERRSEMKDREKSLQGLKALPKGILDPAAFISEFEKKLEVLKKKEKDFSEKRIVRAGWDAEAPDETREEIEIKWKEAQKEFDRIEKEGDAVSEILKTFHEIRKLMDEGTMDPWMEELQKVVAPLTLNRYRGIRLGEGGWGGAERADGVEVPSAVLSMGTRVGMGLALRLSMARYFLKDLDGFMVLDDPLVDMDPGRQEAAVRVLSNFSKEKQTIIFTCHPGHAELLGGHKIELSLVS
jgi:exonuclease SbcC